MEKHICWSNLKGKELEDKVLGEYSNEEVRKHIEYLSTLIRRAGTEGELKAAKYIKSKLEEYGVDAQIYELDGYVSYPGEAEFEILSPVKISLPCNGRTFIPSTGPGGVEAEVIRVSGKGGEEDYQGVDVRGKIVLLEPARLGRAQASYLAEEKGAVVQIHVTPGKGERKTINMGQVRYTWGNPTPDTVDKLPKTPAISISNEDGKFLADLIGKGRVVAKLKTDAAWRGYKKIRLPIGAIKGLNEPDKYTIIGGHYCSWFFGASDNATSNSLTLEMARIFSKHRKHLSRGIKFVWWSGHEQGTYAGSTWYLDNFWDDVRDNAVAYFVMDGIGRKDSSGYEPKNTEEIRKFHERVMKEVLGQEIQSRRVTRGGDQSFWGMGVPSVSGMNGFTAEQIAAFDGEPVWYHHTAEDTLDKVDFEVLKIPFKVNVVAILRLCNNPILPFEFVTMAEQFTKRLIALQGGFGSVLNLGSSISQAEEMRRKAEVLNHRIEEDLLAFEKSGTDKFQSKFKEINTCLMELSRILIPVLFTEAGKYGQDSHHSSYKPIPILQPLEKINSMEPDSNEYRALHTSLVRARNKVSDTLYFANRILSNTLGRISSIP
jgi:hypothetical protein